MHALSHLPRTLHPYSHWLKFEPCPHFTHDHHHGHPRERYLFTLISPLSTSQLSSCHSSSPLSSSSATSSSRSSIRRSWKTCATPRPTGVRVPTTSSTSPHFQWDPHCTPPAQCCSNMTTEMDHPGRPPRKTVVDRLFRVSRNLTTLEIQGGGIPCISRI